MPKRAVDCLIIAFKKWNSRPRMVIPKNYSNKLKDVANLTDRNFYTRLKIYEPEHANSYNLKIDLKRLELY